MTARRPPAAFTCAHCTRVLPKGADHWLTPQLAVWCDRCCRRFAVTAAPHPTRHAVHVALGRWQVGGR